MLVKICGIKTLSVAQTATNAGADFLGLNFIPTSKRCITEEVAREIIVGLRPVAHSVRFTGVFQNQPLEFVNKTAESLGLDFVQLHGEESSEYCAQIKRPIIKAFSLDSDFDVEATTTELRKYKVAFYMLDRAGRKGELLNFQKISELAKEFPIILAGGLTPKNVKAVIAASGSIKGVDVAGGVETNGEKDSQKIQAFIPAARK